MRIFLRLFFLALLPLGCTTPETSIRSSDLSFFERCNEFEKKNRPIKISESTVVLDVRPFFDYQMGRIKNSVHIKVKEFSLLGYYGDALEQRASKVARRLALLGVTPFSHVVVVGHGPRGQGEEGELSFSLLVLGIEQVQIGRLNRFRKLLTATKPTTPKANARYWEPRLITSLICSPLNDTNLFVLTVDDQKIYTASQRQSEVQIRKGWKSFVHRPDFSPNVEVVGFLSQQKIRQKARIRVRGKQASMAAFTLNRLGYPHVCVE